MVGPPVTFHSSSMGLPGKLAPGPLLGQEGLVFIRKKTIWGPVGGAVVTPPAGVGGLLVPVGEAVGVPDAPSDVSALGVALGVFLAHPARARAATAITARRRVMRRG
ncbi:MAG TPA: hypothetical protein DGT23_03235 [Micromonosporaceae bacterium]|nr:hypothetical protein [Micromonosporaceae bacterium]